MPAPPRWISRRKSVLKQVAPLAGRNAHAQRVQLDEAFGILLIVGTGIIFKGCDAFIKQTVFRATTYRADTSLVQLDSHFAIHVALTVVDHLLHHLALFRPPEAVVDDFGVTRHQFVFQVGRFAVQGDRLDGTVGLHHDGAPRRLVAATGLHADKAVFNDIQTANTVGTTHLVQVLQHGCRAHLLAVDGHDIALAVGQYQVGRLIRRLLGADAPAPHVFLGFRPRIFQNAAFIGDMQQVGIHGVRRLLLVLAEVHRNVALFAVGHQRFTGSQIPLAPGSDHLDARLECVGTQLETHLVVALAGCTVRDGIGAGFVGNLDQTFGDQRARNRRAEQILAFIDGIGTEHREYEVTHKLFTQVFNVDLFHAQRFGLGTCRLHLFTLPQIGSEGHHFAVVGILQPAHDDGGIKPTRIRQYDLFDIGHVAAPETECAGHHDRHTETNHSAQRGVSYQKAQRR